MKNNPVKLADQGLDMAEVMEEMKEIKQHDTDWRKGRMFGYIYHAGEEEARLIEEAYRLFFHENALNPSLFSSLKKFENDVVAMTASLLNAPADAAGNITSGGTESILMAVKSARDMARALHPEITDPEVVLPVSAHPAFDKAMHYLGVRGIHVPVGEDKRADVEAIEKAITGNTILLVASAPCFPHGVIDPVEAISKLAIQHGIPFHVDACMGGFMLPFVEKLGYPLPLFDFRVPGVTSMSADVHKYGYSAKGASVILYINSQYRKYQYFAYANWPGGLYGSPTLLGTKCGGPAAAAWAIMKYLGFEGYLNKAREVMDTAKRIQAGIREIPGLYIIGRPDMSVFAFGSDRCDIFAVGDELAADGWHLDRLQFPNCLHMTVSYDNAGMDGSFLIALKTAVKKVLSAKLRNATTHAAVALINQFSGKLPDKWFRKLTKTAARLFDHPEGKHPGKSAAMYGITASIDNRDNVHEMVLSVLDNMYKTG